MGTSRVEFEAGFDQCDPKLSDSLFVSTLGWFLGRFLGLISLPLGDPWGTPTNPPKIEMARSRLFDASDTEVLEFTRGTPGGTPGGTQGTPADPPGVPLGGPPGNPPGYPTGAPKVG